MKVTKKQDHQFRTEATLEALCKGAKPINEDIRNGNYRIEGKINSLEVWFDDNIKSELYCAFCRFDNANALTGVSGKYNFYARVELTPEEAVKLFAKHLKECVNQLN